MRVLNVKPSTLFRSLQYPLTNRQYVNEHDINYKNMRDLDRTYGVSEGP